MNFIRYFAATAALFVFIFLYESLVHGYLLMEIYQETPQVWRNFDEMTANIPLSMCFQLALSIWSVFAFTQIYRKGGVRNGLLFGLFFGVFSGILTASWFLWLPVSATLGWSWFLSGIAEGLGGGLVMGSIYKA